MQPPIVPVSFCAWATARSGTIGLLCGVQGVIMDGGVQWMTAGRGIVHSEMPKITQGDLWGFQLWINLPAKDKMIKPRYQDYQAADIPTVSAPSGCDVRVMAGEFQGTAGAPHSAPMRAPLGGSMRPCYSCIHKGFAARHSPCGIVHQHRLRSS